MISRKFHTIPQCALQWFQISFETWHFLKIVNFFVRLTLTLNENVIFLFPATRKSMWNDDLTNFLGVFHKNSTKIMADWSEQESSPNLAATLLPNDETNHNDSDILVNQDRPDIVKMYNCSLPTPFFKWVLQKFREITVWIDFTKYFLYLMCFQLSHVFSETNAQCGKNVKMAVFELLHWFHVKCEWQ